MDTSHELPVSFTNVIDSKFPLLLIFDVDYIYTYLRTVYLPLYVRLQTLTRRTKGEKRSLTYKPFNGNKIYIHVSHIKRDTKILQNLDTKRLKLYVRLVKKE